ncbi:MAG: hypothetical protein ABIJ92_02715 [Candidatus Aenigmatarchaeota archaeon]
MLRYAVIFVISLLLMPALVLADVGIGIGWTTESESVHEESTKCVTYNLYNPFDQDVNGRIEALGQIKDMSEAEEPKIIPAGTSSKEALPTEICFTPPKVYQDDCILGPLLCSRTCDENQELIEGDYEVIRSGDLITHVLYRGEVQAAYDLKHRGGTGSATGSSISATMKIIVPCEILEKDALTGLILHPASVYVGVIVIVIIIGLVFFRRRRDSGFEPHKNPWN